MCRVLKYLTDIYFLNKRRESMKYLILLTIICVPFLLFAQQNIDGLVKAERSFSAYAVAHGIKPAFLQFADSAGVMFDNGQAVNALHLWNTRENRSGILNWFPTYVEIAASQDFGYTTGPWTFQATSLQDSVIGRGRFITVWHINANGEWKFLVDLGVSNAPVVADTILRKVEITDPSISAGTVDDLKDAEKKFIEASKKSFKDAYQQFVSGQVILNRNNLAPARTADELRKALENIPQGIQFTMTGSGIASTGDLGYVYGTTLINSKNENYLHIWRKEKDGWKLALEVLRF